MSQLRKTLGSDRVVTEPGGYRVVLGDGELDSTLFEALVADGRHDLAGGDAARAVSKLRDAVALWRGAALADAAGAGWAIAESTRLDELRLVATECLLEAQLALGDSRGVVASAEAAVTKDPLRERLWALLITALYRDGRQADALRAYQRVRRQLDEELGIEPGTELQELERRVLRQEPDLTPKETTRAPARSLPTGVVTFLLTDVVGSTRLWERAPSEMSDAVSRHEVLLRDAVERHQGVLLKSRGEGDSTFSVFQRATDAVAAAVDALSALDEETWPTPSPLEVRIAVHTGEAVERDGDYYGRTVNRAARLRAAAIPSQVAVSQATAELVVDDLPDGFRLQTLGIQQLRDIDRPETVFVIAPVGEAAPAMAAETEERIPLPSRLAVEPNMGFVGRERGGEQLANAFKHASTGSGRVVLIAGEPGIGKTGLAAQFARLVHNDGATVLFGRCDEDSGVPYRPWIEAIGHFVTNAGRRTLDRIGTRAAADLCRLVPALGDRRPGLAAAPASGDPDSDRWSLYAAVVELFNVASEDASVVLVLDDLQWADKPSLLLLRHIVQAAQSFPLFVIGTYRDSEVTADHPLAGVLAALRREPTSERLVLRGLDDNEVVALVQGASGQPLGDDAVALVHAVCRETDGNPFFVEALLRHLAETGAVYLDDDGRWAPHADLDEAGLPESVREVIGHRVARLGEMCQRALNVAAVIGQEFDLATVAAALVAREDDILDAIEAAEAAGLVSTFRPGSFTFSHALIATTLYTGLTPTRRANLHRGVAEAIESADPDGHRVAELARHWSAATAPADRGRAMGYARRAGDKAMRALAPDEALRWYGRALELLAESTDDQRAKADLLVRLGRAQRNAGDPAHRSTLLDAARLAHRIGDGKLLARAALANNQGFVGNVDRQTEDRREMLEAALNTVDKTDSVTRARLLATLAAELRVLAENDRCRQLADEAVAIARRLDNPQLLAAVLNLAAFAIWHPVTLAERLAITAEAVELADAVGDRALLHWSASWRVHALVECGDVDGAARWLDVMTSVAAETQQPSLQWSNRAFRAALVLLHGDVDEALRISADAVRVAGALSDVDTRIIHSGVVASAALQRGALAEHMATLQAEQAWYDGHAESSGWRPFGGNYAMHEVQTVLAMTSAAREVAAHSDDRAGRILRALEAQEVDDEAGLREVVRQASENRRVDIGWLGNQVLWAEVCDRIGTADDAQHFLDALTPYHDQVASCGALWPGPVACALGILAAKMDRLDEAEAYFAEAEAVNTRIRAPFFLARNRVNWARLLLRRGRPGDSEQATELLETALEVAREYDCGGVIRDAEALLATPPPLPARLRAVSNEFVGRASELDAFSAASEGGRAVLVAGEPGVGKTALVVAAAAAAREKGAWVLYGRCDEDLRVPFLPFVEAITSLLSLVPASTLDRIGDRHLAELVRLEPSLVQTRPSLPSPRSADPETERYLFMNAVVAALVETSRVAPLVLVIDDLHWADKSTLTLLRMVLGEFTGSGLSMLTTYRHTDLLADSPLAEVLPQLRGDAAVHHLMLGGMSATDVELLTGADAGLAAGIHHETDGNPFFAKELFRHVQETGGELGTGVPDAVRGLVRRRVARLGDEVSAALVTASAIGQEFDVELVARTLARDRDDVADALERAEGSALVTTVAPERFSFAHALIQHALYDELAPTRRSRLHREIATAIEGLEHGEYRAAELARHWTEAAVTTADVAKAIDHASRAATLALDGLAPAEAVRWYGQALELLSRQPAPEARQRLALLLGLTQAQMRSGDPLFRRGRQQAAELAIQLDDTEALVAAALTDYQWELFAAYSAEQLALVDVALDRVGDEDSAARARLLARSGLRFNFSNPERFRRDAQDAVEMARRVGDNSTLVEVLCLGSMYVSASADAPIAAAEALALADTLGDPPRVFGAARWGFDIAIQVCNLADAENNLARMRQLTNDMGRLDYRAATWFYEAGLRLMLGDLAGAEELAAKAHDLARELRIDGNEVLSASQLIAIRWHQGRHNEMRERLAEAALVAPDLHVLGMPITTGELSAEADLLTTVQSLQKDQSWLVAAPILADVVARRGHREAAALLYERMLPDAAYFAGVAVMSRGPVPHSLAVLARTMGELALAEQHFVAADEMNTRMRAPFFQARTWLEWADLCDQRGDDERATELRQHALATAGERGYGALERRAAQALSSGRPSSAP